MNQRLVWNFEFAEKARNLPKKYLVEQELDHPKWEMRFFWPDSEIIVLNQCDESLLHISNYQCKYREDSYYLLPDNNYNIKRRRNQLLYKPLMEQSNQAIGFGKKITLDDAEETINIKDAVEVLVKKEALIYKFSTEPAIKLELARLEVFNKVYLSLCIEGKSLRLVETIAEHLLEQQVSCDYVTFLKSILPS